MAQLNGFWNAFNVVFPLRDFLYLLQLEEYETAQYLERLKGRVFRRGFEQRDSLKLTSRIRFIALAALAIMTVGAVLIGLFVESLALAIVLVAAMFVLTPYVVLVANIVVAPISALAHARLNAQAKRVRDERSNLRVIAVAGSYGKTTTKNFLFEMVRRHFKAQLIGGNINTTAGIAQWMLKSLEPSTELLIVEMDAYHPGEIAESCAIVQPDMAILTSIGDQHLMRFGSQQAIVQALQEVLAGTVRGGLCVCSDEVASILKEYGYQHSVRTVPTTSITYEGQVISTEHLSDSVREDAAYATAIARELEIPVRFVDEAIRSFALPDRRQRPAEVFGYEGIDDSYNISVATAQAGVLAAKAMAQKADKKLVVLTAGIPELPPEVSVKENQAYGAFLCEHAHSVLLLESEFASLVMRGIDHRVDVYTAKNLHRGVEILHKECATAEFVLLFQPELTDASY